MPDEQDVDRAGVELASEMLRHAHHVLLAFLVRGKDGGEALELGVWSVTPEGRLVRPSRPLLLPVGEVDRVRALAERAVAALPHATCGKDAAAVLERDGKLGATIERAPDGSLWATLRRMDDGGLAAVPAAEIGSLVRVLAEAECQLAELGRVALPSPSA
jgi:hypothetical protein